MKRRSLLRFIAIGTVPTVAGCLEGGADPNTPTISELETGYPRFSAAYYTVTARRAEGSEDTPIPFSELSPESRIEFANAIGRGRFLIGRSPALLRADRHREVISYRDSTFDVGVAVADAFREPEHGPNGDPDWTDPVELDASAAENELTVTITNRLDTRLDVHHFRRPYFGVLLAVNETVSVLDHDYYEENEHIRTSDAVTTALPTGEELRRKSLDSGESVAETYAFEENLIGESVIWFSVPMGDDSIELFGNRPTTMTASITLEP